MVRRCVPVHVRLVDSLSVLTCLCFVSLQLYLQRLKRTLDKLNCEKSLWEGTDQCKIPTKGWEQKDYMHIRPKSGFSHCRAGDCSELSHMLVLFIYFVFYLFLIFKNVHFNMSCCCGTVYRSHLPLFWDTFHHYHHPPCIDNYDQMSLPGSSDGDCPSCLKDNIQKCRNLFCPDRSDTVTVCNLVGFSLLSCCRTRKHSARAELD